MLAKLKANGVSDDSVKLIDSLFYRSLSQSQTGASSKWMGGVQRMLSGSAFGPLLWNIYQNDLTYDIDVNLNMYADDHQFYAMSSVMEIVNA